MAKVDWIDKEAPTATFEYTSNSATNRSVIATLKPNEKVTVTNNGNYTVDDEGNIYNVDGIMIPGLKADKNGDVWDTDGNYVTNVNPFTYEFLSNGEFTFEFVDTAGNKGTATAKVDWIDTKAPKATIKYDIKTLTNKNVTVSISFDKEDVTVINNDGKTNYVFTKNGEFTFQFQDAAGNTGSITANVDWIDKVAPTAELKYEKQEDKVIVTVVNPSKEITFKEGNGIYEYTRNGNYEIVFYDSLGNVGKLIAKIDSFEEEIKDDGNKPENPDKPNNPGGSKPEKPNNPDSNKPNNSDNNLDDSDKPNDNTNNSSDTNNNTNNDNKDDDTTTEKPDNDETNNEEQKPSTDNTDKEDNNNSIVQIEKDSKGNKVILVVITTALSLLTLCGYVIKKLK